MAAAPGVPLTTPETAPVGKSSNGVLLNRLDEYTGTGISSRHPPNWGYCAWKNALNALQLSTCSCVDSDWGTVGKTTLQVIGDQAAVMLAATEKCKVCWPCSCRP